MHFQYSAKSATGQLTTGMLEAQSPIEARQQLRAQGLFALSLKDHHVALQLDGAPRRGLFSRSRVTKRDLLMLSTQLAIMTRSGIDLAEALKNSARQCQHPRLKAALDDVYASVADGQSPSQALKKQSHIFGDAYVAAVAAGEASGNVPEVLDRLSELLKNELKLQSTLKSVLSYPLVITLVASVVLTALVFFVLPQFAQVFEDIGAPAPPLTRFLLDGAQLLREYIVWLVAGAALFVVGFVRLWKTEAALRYRHRLLLHAVLVRHAARALLTGRSFRLIGTMLESGVPLLDAIRLCRSAIGNVYYRELFEVLERDVLEGRGVSDTLASSPFVPSGAVEMIVTAERTGKLGSIMATVGEYYEDEGERQVRDVARFVEPAIIVALGIVVGLVVLAVMLPLLDVSSVGS